MRSALEDYLDTLKGKKIAVVGIGISNRPLIELLLDAGISVTACDKREREEFDGFIEALEQRGAVCCLGEDYLEHLDGMDVIFRTPGMRPDLPQLERARAQGAEITSEMEAFFSVCPCSIIAVTGSDGKTTTTTIIAGLLKASGYRTYVGGNIGRPLLSQAGEMRPDDMVVLELSSFQLMTMGQSPDVAVITNLAPNHLDVHKDMQEYIDAKRNIFLHQSTESKLVLNADNEITASFAPEARGSVTMFSRKKALGKGVWLKDGVIVVDSRPVLPVKDILIPGVHNIENYMAAIAAVDGLVTDETIREYAKTFGGVEHRIELVRELNGVRYYNDSIASSPSRTIAGLRSFDQKVILIAGGYDKHIPYDVLGPEITRAVKTLILVGATGPKIKEAVMNAPDYQTGQPVILERDDLRGAVNTAYDMAQPGDVVILSPASASFDQFKNFEERGNTFKKYVEEL
jgi:UDP-N-acetylmuramoylalanine--D-glutamate ligase